jgi:hypothetical protein
MENAVVESKRIIDEARARGVVLRLAGGLAVRQHCREFEFCERDYGDIDFVGLSQQSPAIIEIIEGFGYHENVHYTLTTGGMRLLFEKPGSTDHVDVFLDRLRMEHDIDLRGRLEIEENTISVSDILVTKFIITKMNEKDYRDIITIVKDLALGEEDAPETINIKYIGALCAENWGLYHDVITTLDACADFMRQYHLGEATAHDVLKKLMLIRTAIVAYPKSVRWRLRSHIGTRLAWRREVELQNKV